MDNGRACTKCGALIHPDHVNKHNGWHAQLERDVKEAHDDARRAKRASRS
jgi:hypothetical protein